MLHSRALVFDQPEPFQQALELDCTVLPDRGGNFEADLVSIDFGRLWLKRTRSSTPFAASLTMTAGRTPLMFLPDPDQAQIRLNGIEATPDHLILGQRDGTLHARNEGNYRVASMSLLAEDLAASSKAIVGREIVAAPHTQVLRPSSGMMARLRAIHHAACAHACNDSSSLEHAAAGRALEQELIRAMVECLATSLPCGSQHSGSPRVVARFRQFLESKRFEPVYVAEICAAIGVSEGTLRNCCREQLGMGPIHYLWLRRMHLARRALLAPTGSETVTDVATNHGFWELGRFSVEYRRLFGESPSATLKRARGEAWRSKAH